MASLLAGAVIIGPPASSAPTPTPPVSTEALGTSVAALDGRLATVTSDVTGLQSRISGLQGDLAVAAARVEDLSSTKSELERRNAQLIAAAQRQALAAYVNNDPTRSQYALFTVLAQQDTNDVAWSLGVMKVTNAEVLNRAKAARLASHSTSSALVEAVRDKADLDAAVKQTNADLATAAAELATLQQRLDALRQALGATTVDGMTTVVYDAYLRSAGAAAAERASCGLRWQLLAAIGKTESNHGRGRLDAEGNSVIPIVGPAYGPDTDAGQFDGDPSADHAVGPMQFIPPTWGKWGADGDGDGKSDMGNIYDEALAAGRYLCAAAGDLTLATKDGVIRAILSYNPNQEYLRVVGLRYEALVGAEAAGWFSAATLPEAPAPTGTTVAPLPARDPSPPAPPAPPLTTKVTTFAPFTATGIDPTIVTIAAVPGTCIPLDAPAGRAGWWSCVDASDAPIGLQPGAPKPSTTTPATQAPSSSPAAPSATATDSTTSTSTTTTTTTSTTATTTTTSSTTSTTVASTTTTTAPPTTTTTIPGTPPPPLAVLTPCLLAPYDPTLLACVGDPAQPVALVTVAAPLAPPPVPGAPPPYLAIVLDGGDVCRPVVPSPQATAAHALYQCLSGAIIVAPPTAGSAWTATVRQVGIGDRVAPVLTVWR